MIIKNIRDEIVCEHIDRCKSYSVWSNGKCRFCRNNKYENPKKDYYKAPLGGDIAMIIAVLFFIFVIFA